MLSISDFVRVGADTNGNPRYVIAFYRLGFSASPTGYLDALALARPFGGKRYRGKDFGGGIVFTSYALRVEVVDPLNARLKDLNAGVNM